MLKVSYEKFVELLNQNPSTQQIRENDIGLRCAIQNIKLGRKVFIWPAGKVGKKIYESLKANGYNNLVLVDQKSNEANIVSPNKITFGQNDVLIIASLNYSKGIYEKANKMKCNNIIMYYSIKELGEKEPIVFPNNFYDKCFEELTAHLVQNAEAYKNMYFALADEVSKRAFLNNMFFRLTYDIRYTFLKDDGLQYFQQKLIKFKDNSSIVDGGGYIGDSLKEFLKLGAKFNKYYLFEPDKELLEKAKLISNDKRIEYIPFGLYSTSKKISFQKTLDDGGCIAKNGDCEVAVVSLDEYIEENITFIKMDIEGAELEALEGAKETIMKYTPHLCICIYHKPKDYLEIYEYIKMLNDKYVFYIRQHSNGYAENVLYAINVDLL